MMSSDLQTNSPAAASPGGIVVPPDPRLDPADWAALRGAVEALERSTLTGRLSTALGRPLEIMGQVVPDIAKRVVSRAVDSALKAALKVALSTLRPEETGARTTLPVPATPRTGRLYTAAAAATGAVGGAFGLASLPVELPVSTVLILRGIAEIAREEGENIDDPETALQCLQVFALGSRSENEDMTSSGYFAVRAALARSIGEAAKIAGGRRLAGTAAPATVRLLAEIASRFGLVVSQKVVAGAVPIVGAAGGAAVNIAFMEHFRAVARAHFTVRRLERRYGADKVRDAYHEIKEAGG